MGMSATLKAFLQEAKVRYETQRHPLAYTAQEVAAAQHVPGRQVAKCVLVKTDRGPALAVLPAIHRINLKQLKSLLQARRATIATEADIKQAFPDVDVGAMSAFGNLYHVPVVVDQTLEAAQEIVCNAGSHTETIKLRYEDFARLVKPTVGPFGQPISPPASTSSRKKSSGRKTTRKASRSSTRRPAAETRRASAHPKRAARPRSRRHR